MTGIYSIDIQCDKCGKWSGGDTGANATMSKLRKAYRKLGWTVSRDGTGITKDYCPKCSAKLGKSQRGEGEVGK